MALEVEIDRDMDGGFQLRREWRRVAALADRQHRVVSRDQLRRLGLTRDQIDGLVRSRQIAPVHHGVYALGHRLLSREGAWMAAVLAGGRRAVLSHLAAAHNWQLLNPVPCPPSITTPTKGRRRPGIETHTSQLRADEVTVHDGIPTTTVARTILDLAAIVDRRRLERAIAEAEFRRYSDSPSLPELLDRHRGRRGVLTLRGLLARGDLGRTESRLEDRFVEFLDGRRLERPELNAPLDLGDGEFIRPDCVWRRLRLAVELDGRDAHQRRETFASDRRRDRRLSALGWRPVRIVSEHLDAPDELEADLLALGVQRR